MTPDASIAGTQPQDGSAGWPQDCSAEAADFKTETETSQLTPGQLST